MQKRYIAPRGAFTLTIDRQEGQGFCYKNQDPRSLFLNIFLYQYLLSKTGALFRRCFSFSFTDEKAG